MRFDNANHSCGFRFCACHLGVVVVDVIVIVLRFVAVNLKQQKKKTEKRYFVFSPDRTAQCTPTDTILRTTTTTTKIFV